MYEDAYTRFGVSGIVPLRTLADRQANDSHPSSHAPRQRAIQYFPPTPLRQPSRQRERSPSPVPGPSRPREPSPPYKKRPINRLASRVNKRKNRITQEALWKGLAEAVRKTHKADQRVKNRATFRNSNLPPPPPPPPAPPAASTAVVPHSSTSRKKRAKPPLMRPPARHARLEEETFDDARSRSRRTQEKREAQMKKTARWINRPR
jgi:hypothetical protein